MIDHKQYDITVVYYSALSIEIFFSTTNAKIREIAQNQPLAFIPDKDGKQVIIKIQNESELRLSEKKLSKLFYMLHLPERDSTISESTTCKYRPWKHKEKITFTTIDKRSLKEKSFILPLTYIKPVGDENNVSTCKEIIAAISKNLKWIFM